MKRRRWKPEQKALIVFEGLKGRPIGELCAEHEISQAQYYQWRDLFLANAAKTHGSRPWLASSPFSALSLVGAKPSFSRHFLPEAPCNGRYGWGFRQKAAI
jgi:transposase-like protein